MVNNQIMSKRIKNVNWYYSLKEKNNSKGLFADYPRNVIRGKMLVCWDFYDEVEHKTHRLYTLFKNYIEFALYHFSLPEHMRCFYEIILGENPQKPHFDLDISLSKYNLSEMDVNKILENLVQAIIITLDQKDVKINLEKHICIYQSHGIDKFSFHIVINNYCHTNNEEAKAFYEEVMTKLSPEYIKWIDRQVYSITQQFRCLGSQKHGTNRVKNFIPVWNFQNKTIHHQYEEETDSEKRLFLIQLNESIVSARTSECTLLPPFRKFTDVDTTYTANEDIDMDEAKEAMNLLAKSGGINWKSSKNPFRFDRIEGPFVVLKRVKSSRCRICKRIHEHQNPYLWIANDGAVYYHCRRAPPEKKLFVGKLARAVSSNSSEEEEPTLKNMKPVCNNFILNNIKNAQNMAKSTTKYGKKVKEVLSDDAEVPLGADINKNIKKNFNLYK